MTKEQADQKVRLVIRRLEDMFGEGVHFMSCLNYQANQVQPCVALVLPGVAAWPVACLGDSLRTRPVEEIAQDTAARFQMKLRQNRAAMQLPRLDINRDFILSNVFFQVVSQERNRDLMVNRLCVPFLDLLGVFRVCAGEVDGRVCTFTLPLEALDVFSLTLEELREAAERNQRRLFDVAIVDPAEASAALEKDPGWQPEPLEETRLTKGEIYTLYTPRACYASGVLLAPQVLKTIGEVMDGDYFILPASTEHLQILSVENSLSPQALRRMVYDINRDGVSVTMDTVLTDNVYRYSRDSGTLDFA